MSREPEPVLDRPGRRVQSYVTGRHLPNPYFDGQRWRCRDCCLVLTRYHTELGVLRLRHHPKGKT